ncbi:MAG TPA: SPOR domain-containing protein [Candidatus Binataceae bacterium]|nr:SPOR domain-containing protein [Candidatus Binataceae bacterium]
MRFEIRAGGAFLILVGLAGLSCVVFALGLVAGYEMARQTAPAPVQVATYPLPAPPADAAAAQSSVASPAPSPALASIDTGAGAVDSRKTATTAEQSKPAAAPSPGVSSLASGGAATIAKPVAPPVQAKASAIASPAAKPSAAIAKANPPALKPRAPEPVDDSSDTGAQEETSPAPPSESTASAGVAPKYTPSSVAVAHNKAFNIQIDAVMDRTSAEQMAAKMSRLGYHAFLVPTNLGGQTWWRVRVGPYDSEEQAHDAEKKLLEQYRATYAGGE